MATFGFVLTLVAMLFRLFCPVIGAPIDPKGYLDRLAHSFNSISHALPSDNPRAQQPEFSQDRLYHFVEDYYGREALWGPSETGHATMNTAAPREPQPHEVSHYSPDMTAVHINNQPWYPAPTHYSPQQYPSPEHWQTWQQQHLASPGEQSWIGTNHQPDHDGAASSSRGGAGSSGHHSQQIQPGLQQQPSALTHPGPGSYGAIEPWMQYQHPSSPGGPGSYDLDNLLDYSPEQINEWAGILDSPDFAPSSSSSLPHSQAVQVDAPRNVAKRGRPRGSKSRLKAGRTRGKNRAAADEGREMTPEEVNQATIDDLRRNDYPTLRGDLTLRLALALRDLTDQDLLRHAQLAFQADKTALQSPVLMKQHGRTSASQGFVHSTDQQAAIIQELYNRRIERYAHPEDKTRRIRIIPDATYSPHDSTNHRRTKKIFERESVATKGPFETPDGMEDGVEEEAYLAPFSLGGYGIYAIPSYYDASPEVYAIPSAAFDRIREARVSEVRKYSRRPADEAKSILLGRYFFEYE